jgi:hypothetical protein
MHFVGAGQLHGFEQRLTADIYPGDFGWTGDWTEVRPKFANDVVTFTDAGVCTRNLQIEYDDKVCHRARRKICDLARDIFTSQRRRLFLREVLAKGALQDWDYSPGDELEQHCLRAKKIYSSCAYEGVLGYRFPEE